MTLGLSAALLLSVCHGSQAQAEPEPVLAQEGSLDSLRAAVEYLLKQYPGEYQQEWLEEVRRLEERIGPGADAAGGIPASLEEVDRRAHV